ncbi:hypothetical protein PWT90_02146 [Aphanocladium album]|nr:hypothetical protein PWT90_02146 [Aphanocladium album]
MPRYSEDNCGIYPVHLIDAGSMNHKVVSFLFRFNDVLDVDKLHVSLAQLLEHGDWRKLGGRLQRTSDGKLELRVPQRFTDKEPAVAFAKQDFSAVSIKDHHLGKHLPEAGAVAYSRSIAGDTDFRSFAIPHGFPSEMKDFIASQAPQIALLTTSFNDATLVSLVWPHTLFDGSGFSHLLQAWSLKLAGRDHEIPAVLGAKEDVLGALDNEVSPTTDNFDGPRRLRGLDIIFFVVVLLWHRLFYPPRDTRMIFLPRVAVDQIKLEAKKDSGDTFITEGDSILAWAVSLITSAEPKAHPMTVLQLANGRGRLQCLAKSGGVYLQNIAAFMQVVDFSAAVIRRGQDDAVRQNPPGTAVNYLHLIVKGHLKATDNVYIFGKDAGDNYWLMATVSDKAWTGSIGGGNTFPGVSRPLGIVKLGPDLYSGTDAYSGYLAKGNFTGFSLLHESGTGGAPKYGVVSQMPVVGKIDDPLVQNTNDTRAEADFTEVGYYRAKLGSGTTVELAATTKAGILQYTFPKTDKPLNIWVDVSHVLSSYRGQGLGQHYLGGNITVSNEPDKSGFLYYTGSGKYDNGWNRAAPWTVYFCGHFDAPATYKVFRAPDGKNNKREDTNQAPRTGALFTFNQTSVVSRVGVSFISTQQACDSVAREIPRGTALRDVQAQTRQVWNNEVFSKVTTTETNTTKLNQLYSALYFMHLLPQNKTGENPLWKSDEPYYDDIFTFWDIYRCTTSLLHILQPTYHEELLRSMIDIWRNVGWVSDARSSFSNGAVQGGSNSDNVFADAYVKGVRGKVNWDDAFASMVKNAEKVPPNNNDSRDPTGSTREGRSALPDWLKYGFITPKFSRSVSRAVEYSVNDFSLATVAAGLGKDTEFDRYFNRSHNWRNHWNSNMTALGFTGFVGPRNTSGFISQDPLSCGGCYWRDYYYQALPWEYSFNAHHDLAKLISLCDGDETFVKRLEKTFEPGVFSGNGAFGHTLFNPGNEPSFTTPYLYNYVDRQDLAVERSRFIAKSYYHPTRDGLPGNSDAGAMESWLLWNMIGLYPMTGQTTFFIGSPWFSDLTIALGGGKTLKVTTKGGSEENYQVQSLKVNGREWNKSWLTWYDIFAQGGTLDFVLGPKAAKWVTGERPPSPGSMSAKEAKAFLKKQVGKLKRSKYADYKRDSYYSDTY